MATCPECYGKKSVKCLECKGSGKKYYSTGIMSGETKACKICGGSGKAVCGVCKGSGYIKDN